MRARLGYTLLWVKCVHTYLNQLYTINQPLKCRIQLPHQARVVSTELMGAPRAEPHFATIQSGEDTVGPLPEIDQGLFRTTLELREG